MKEESPLSKQVDQFILEEIDTIPHLEALQLVWNNRPRSWTALEMAAELYVDPATAREILQGLTRRKLLAAIGTPQTYTYLSTSPARDDLIRAVDATYRLELIRISRMIHSNAGMAVRNFAKAFRFTSERE